MTKISVSLELRCKVFSRNIDIHVSANLCHAIYRVSHGGNDDDENDGGDLDYLVDCRGIILAYAGALLSHTN